MTPAERQRRRRQRQREVEAERLPLQIGRSVRAYRPPHNYGPAKEKLIATGHVFERTRREFGFEEGVFVDGALMGALDVIALANLSPREREQELAERRHRTKDFACGAVEGYMAALRVSLDELTKYSADLKAWDASPPSSVAPGLRAASAPARPPRG